MGGMHPLDAVIFDIDGTLVDSTTALWAAWAQWGTEYDVDAEEADRWHGHSSEEVVVGILGEERAPQALARAVELEIEHGPEAKALPGAVEALAAIPEGHKAIATSGVLAVASARLAGAGIVPPEVFVTYDDVTRAKPDPELFLVAADRLGFAPERCLVVEDSVAGLQAAHAGGFATLAVVTTTPREALDADLVVPGLDGVRFDATADGHVSVRLA